VILNTVTYKNPELRYLVGNDAIQMTEVKEHQIRNVAFLLSSFRVFDRVQSVDSRFDSCNISRSFIAYLLYSINNEMKYISK